MSGADIAEVRSPPFSGSHSQRSGDHQKQNWKWGWGSAVERGTDRNCSSFCASSPLSTAPPCYMLHCSTVPECTHYIIVSGLGMIDGLWGKLEKDS